jgi:chromosomal replication initiation ATPase DnaA
MKNYLTILLIIMSIATTTIAKQKEVKQELKLQQAVSIKRFYAMKFEHYPFTGEWLEHFGKPEKYKLWFIMAHVNSGKTHGVAMVAKYFSEMAPVLYVAYEEGVGESLRTALKRMGVTPKTKISIIDRESISELTVRLKKHKSPEIVIIDTIQHADTDRTEFIAFLKAFPNKQFIVISHMEGKLPEGRLAKFCHQYAFIKGTIKGFQMLISSRFGGGKPMVIWQEGVERFAHEI